MADKPAEKGESQVETEMTQGTEQNEQMQEDSLQQSQEILWIWLRVFKDCCSTEEQTESLENAVRESC